MKKQSPSWSMTSRKFYTHHESTPGPGAYSMASTLSGPNFHMGTSLRSSIQDKINTPGPGAYTPSKLLPFPGNTFMPTSYRQGIAKIGNIPGPGTYNLAVKNDGPFYSLRGRTKNTSVDLIPGPGKYSPDYDVAMEKVPGFKLGVSKRNTDMSSNKSPGPGVYDPKFGSSTPSVNFGRSSRTVSYDNNLPGPGTYELKSTNPGQSYSMTPRRTPLLKDYTPGPGTYTSFIKNQVQAYSLSKSERKGLIDSSDSPGPGAYYPQLPKSKCSNLCNLSLDLAKPQERQ